MNDPHEDKYRHLALTGKGLLSRARTLGPKKRNSEKEQKREEPRPEPIRRVYGRTIAIRFCGDYECLQWQQNRQYVKPELGGGAAYDIMDNNQMPKLIAIIDGAKRRHFGPNLLVLRNAPLAVGDNIYHFEGRRTFSIINSVMDGNSTMVAWINIQNMSAEEAADLVIEVANNPEIMER